MRKKSRRRSLPGRTTPASETRERGGRLRFLRWATLGYAVLLTLLLWLPDPRELLWGWQPRGDVMGYSHLIAFSILGFLVELGRRERSFFFRATLLFGYTLLTEIVQELIPHRSFELIDVAQDLAGLYFGLWCAASGRLVIHACGLSRFFRSETK